jgi:hypothetical protein
MEKLLSLFQQRGRPLKGMERNGFRRKRERIGNHHFHPRFLLTVTCDKENLRSMRSPKEIRSS